MKKLTLIAITSLVTLSIVSAQAANVLPNKYPDTNPRYPQDRSWSYADQGPNGGGGGGAGGGGGD